MKRLLSTCFAIAGLVGLVGPAIAELSIQHDRLTVDVQAAPLNAVLQDLSREGTIEITVLDTGLTDQATVTEQFHNLSVEEGLHRLLAQWNYSLTKHHVTGRIQKVLNCIETDESG